VRISRSTQALIGLFTAGVLGAACSSFGAATPENAGTDSALAPDASTESAPAGDAGADGGGDTDAPSDAPVLEHPPCAEEPACPRYVFVTSKTFSGDLSGSGGGPLVRMDTECAVLAQTAGAPLAGRAYRVWMSLSGAGLSARERNVAGSMPYILRDGTLIANDWSGFASGTHLHGIDQNEKGETVADAVWTATQPSGDYSGPACTAWDSASGGDEGGQGSSTSDGSGWTDQKTSDCNSQARIYCVER
jgi:hypothetical protein